MGWVMVKDNICSEDSDHHDSQANHHAADATLPGVGKHSFLK